MLITDPWPHRYFTFLELACSCGCERMEIPQHFIERADRAREACGFPLPVNSGYRCPEYNATVSKYPWHTKGAIDFGVSGYRAYRLLAILITEIGGIGICQHGHPASRFIHHDFGPDRIWTYP